MTDRDQQSTDHLNLKPQRRDVKTYMLTEDEMDSLSSVGVLATTALSLFSVFLGSLLTFLGNVDLQWHDHRFTISVLIAATLAFAVMAVASFASSRRRKKSIKGRVNGGSARIVYHSGSLPAGFVSYYSSQKQEDDD